MTKIVEFIEDSPPYAPGEKAGFDDKLAGKFVARGAARYYTEVDGPAPAATPVIVPDVTSGEGAGGTPTVSTLQAAATDEGNAVATSGTVDLDAMSDDELRDLIEKRDGRRPNARAIRETLLEKAKADTSTEGAGE